MTSNRGKKGAVTGTMSPEAGKRNNDWDTDTDTNVDDIVVDMDTGLPMFSDCHNLERAKLPCLVSVCWN